MHFILNIARVIIYFVHLKYDMYKALLNVFHYVIHVDLPGAKSLYPLQIY